MMYRVYWQMPGADSLRKAGPWWCRDFRAVRAVDAFIDDMLPAATEMKITVISDQREPKDPRNIAPPPNAVTVLEDGSWEMEEKGGPPK